MTAPRLRAYTYTDAGALCHRVYVAAGETIGDVACAALWQQHWAVTVYWLDPTPRPITCLRCMVVAELPARRGPRVAPV